MVAKAGTFQPPFDVVHLQKREEIVATCDDVRNEKAIDGKVLCSCQ